MKLLLEWLADSCCGGDDFRKTEGQQKTREHLKNWLKLNRIE